MLQGSVMQLPSSALAICLELASLLTLSYFFFNSFASFSYLLLSCNFFHCTDASLVTSVTFSPFFINAGRFSPTNNILPQAATKKRQSVKLADSNIRARWLNELSRTMPIVVSLVASLQKRQRAERSAMRTQRAACSLARSSNASACVKGCA